MLKNNNLQKKLLALSFMLIAVAIIGLTCLVVLIEKKRYQDRQFSQLYHATFALKENIFNLIQQPDTMPVEKLLSGIRAQNPSILYYVLSDRDGDILVSSNPARRGNLQIATIEHIDQPLYKTSTGFVIYASRLNKAIKQRQVFVADKNERVLDSFWDISDSEETVGSLRIGFSNRKTDQYLMVLAAGMLLFGFSVLLAAALVSFLVLKRTSRSVNQFSMSIEAMNQKELASLKKTLLSFQVEHCAQDPESLFRLKKAVSELAHKTGDRWATAEQHAHELEERLNDISRELRQTKSALFNQTEERKEIETRLLNVQKLEAIGTLAGGIAHEFNNLFMAITGYASLIQKQSDPGHSNITKAQKILGLVDKGSQSVKQLLGFARSGKYTPGALDINKVIRMNLDMFKKTRKDLSIHVKYTQNIWSVFADHSQMDHVIMNLLLNASEAMPDNGRVNIETNNILLEKKKVGMDKIVSGRFVHFSIQDQGKGIETQYLRRVFDPFFTTKPLNEGSGLGLASVYGIVDNHDGFTTVESTVGKGTIFNVFLPAIKK